MVDLGDVVDARERFGPESRAQRVGRDRGGLVLAGELERSSRGEGVGCAEVGEVHASSLRAPDAHRPPRGRRASSHSCQIGARRACLALRAGVGDIVDAVSVGARVGFIGLGIMGEPMALNLVRTGVALTVWNRSERARRVLVDAGATAAAGPAEVFARSEIVILMLAGTSAIDDVLGPDGARRAEMLTGRTVVNMGTVPPEYSARLAAEITGAGGVFVEAPVSGSRRPAEEGTLVGMLAGPEDAVARVTPILEPLCGALTFCGDVPSALTMKLSVNVFLIAVVTGLAESFHFAAQHGVPATLLRQVLDAGQMSSPISRVKTAKLAAEDWTPQASIRDVLMNNELITESARTAGIASPLLDVTRELYADAVARGDGDLDMAAVVRAISDRSAGGASPELTAGIQPGGTKSGASSV